MAHKSYTSPHTSFGVGNKKVFCKFGNSTTSLNPRVSRSNANTEIIADYNPGYCSSCGSVCSCVWDLCDSCLSTLSFDPCVSCNKVYGESTNISDKKRDQSQIQFPNPPFEDLDFILVGLGERRKNCGVIFASYICQMVRCVKVHYSKQSCKRKACPECYKKWLVEERYSKLVVKKEDFKVDGQG